MTTPSLPSMSSLAPSFATRPGEVHALLGPTNTGKTHYALTRMMAHGSGMMGFPLRLLARENYERLVRAKGRHNVALLTGEEKIVPPNARWFSCTVEAMPLDRRMDFVGIDEIQLAADPERGHVFTERLLHARGRSETLFLGAETMRGLLSRLVPGITIDTRPRLSQLSDAGPLSLNRLPPRSAIVAFSATEVYALAEAIRQRRGGCAIIMGRLSPRTRNAQIALYQNREVDYLVATDAIGMGLNMDVDHVALAGLHKFDGRMTRPLQVQEIAQITGRAGRGMRDGTFGTTGSCPPMSTAMVEAIEGHHFEPVRQICWRQSQLDYSGPEALLHSLQRSPPRPELIAGRISSDVEVLNALIRDDKIRPLAQGRKATSLLWDVCQIPDFRKIGDGSHARLCGRLFQELLRNGQVPAQWLDGQLRGLDRTEGDIDTLMHRLSGVRICAYVAARQGWMRNGRHWQQRSREVEERLSDALHERLTARFVNKRATALLRRAPTGEEPELLHAVRRDGRILVEGHEVGQIRGFSLEADMPADGAEAALLMRTARKALRQEFPQRVRRFLQSSAEALEWAGNGVLSWQGAPIARLEKGESFFQPALRLLPGEFQDAAQQQSVEAHATRLVTQHLQVRLQPFLSLGQKVAGQPGLRGLIHRLTEDGGTTPTLAADRQLPRSDRESLRRLGVVIGPRHIYHRPLLKAPLMETMVLLAGLWQGATLTAPQGGRVSLPASEGAGLPGWIEAGPVWVRIDIAETVLGQLLPRRGASQRQAPPDLASRLNVTPAQLPALLKGLLLRPVPPTSLPADQFGPPAPLMVQAGRGSTRKTAGRREAVPDRGAPKGQPKGRKPLADSPFAGLAAWSEAQSGKLPTPSGTRRTRNKKK
ncbi:helicase-related protein [Oecophyllibacter saccharovorans]|uniref:helicase-related protein n=1 Tax=Oecophyllibacter saccharovorans TaxID=2558360 RepID=UPI001E352AF8|nr:helicase-related protein [Oecophyllibacter saccharovorans]